MVQYYNITLTQSQVLTLAALEIELGEFRLTSWPRMSFISSVVPFAFGPPTVHSDTQ